MNLYCPFSRLPRQCRNLGAHRPESGTDMHSLHRRITLVFLVAIAGRSAALEPTWPVERGPAANPPPYVYKPESLRDLPAEYLNDAAACYLYSGTVQSLAADGVLTSTTMEAIRLNTRRGIDQVGEYRSITFNPSYEKVTLHSARVHKASPDASAPGVRIQEIDPHHVQIRDVNTDHQVYDSSKQVVISFPNL